MSSRRTGDEPDTPPETTPDTPGTRGAPEARRMRRLDNIDLRLLRVFVTLAESGSFQAAQIALNLSQSTLSTHVAALEQKLGGSLCLRGRRGFRLTPFGEATLAAARQLFADIDSFQHRLARHGGELVGRLRIGIVDGVITSPALGLQTAIGRFAERAPGVFIDLELATPHDLERAVADGHRDIVIGPLSQKAPGVVYVPLHREAQGLYCGRGHPLFDRPPASVTRAEVERALFSIRTYRHLDDLYRVGHPRAGAAVIHMEAQAMLILSGRFVGFLPCHIGEPWVERGQMRQLRAKIYPYDSQHFAAYRRGSAEASLVDAFLQELRRQAG
ncbi:LysR family transcriptional regulator [Ancylobacter terrae]|uniref:LysR family transcriptional regulator n=1 Tax=Ancylobacter sp. sgz301288 TaxID=3342077 RepID=UPI0038586B0A